MAIGSGCRTHLVTDELPAGRLIVRVSNHLTTVVDGIINDTWDCSWTWDYPAIDLDENKIKIQGKKCVYGYFQKGD